MGQEPTISVIIPVYNAEAFLSQTVDSVLSQDYVDFEMILVDDGSSDGSGKLCALYAQSDERVRVLSRANGGASSARNAGIEAARGEYILFIDSDDRIENGSLARIMRRVSIEGERDVVFLKAMSVFPDGEMVVKDVHDKERLDGRAHEEVLEYMSRLNPLPVCVWGKLIRRSLLIGYGIRFLEGIILEDVDFCISLYLRAATYNYIDETYYYYMENRPGSVMNANTDRKFFDLLAIIERWVALAKGEYSAFQRYVESMLAFQYCMLLGMYWRLPKARRKAQKLSVARLKWLLRRSGDNRVRMLAILTRLTGVSGAALAMYAYEEIKGGKR